MHNTKIEATGNSLLFFYKRWLRLRLIVVVMFKIIKIGGQIEKINS